MQLSAVQVIQKLLQLSRRVNILEVIKQIHVSEWIDGDQRQIRLGFAQMLQRMGKLFAIGREEIDVFWNKNPY